MASKTHPEPDVVFCSTGGEWSPGHPVVCEYSDKAVGTNIVRPKKGEDTAHPLHYLCV